MKVFVSADSNCDYPFSFVSQQMLNQQAMANSSLNNKTGFEYMLGAFNG